jgi:hypothetical protein
MGPFIIYPNHITRMIAHVYWFGSHFPEIQPCHTMI